MKTMELDSKDGVGWLWLTNSARHNAMGFEFFDELKQMFGQIDEDKNLRVVVLAARGVHFCSGLDLKSPVGAALREHLAGGLADTRLELLAQVRKWQEAIGSVANCRVPVLAATQGACIGGGLDLIAACDCRYCTSDALFSLRETKMAIVADLGSLQRLSGIVGEGLLREFAFTGQDWDAQQALRVGLVNHIAPTPEALYEHVGGIATQIASNSGITVRGVKEALDTGRRTRIAQGLDRVALWNAAFLASADLNEAMQAFSEHRIPNFQR